MKADFIFNTKVVFTSVEEARRLLSVQDSYTDVLTRFDLQAKTKTLGNVNVCNYLENAQRYVSPWLDYEIEYLKDCISATSVKIKEAELTFNLPKQIYVIKSAMHEEGGANGFTRRECIVLNQNSLSHHLFEHELFHIISRFNSRQIEKAYGVIGFTKCNEVEIPKQILNRKISNPDAPFNNYFITVTYNGVLVEAVMILYAIKDYDGGGFFKYVNKGLMLVEGPLDNKRAVIENGMPKIIKQEEVTGFFEQIGRNTGYNIHQEEITADHFIMVLNKETGLPDQHLVDELAQAFK